MRSVTHPALTKRAALLFLPMALLVPGALEGKPLRVSPGDALADVSRRLASDRRITEVVLEEGVYRETLDIPALAGADGAPAGKAAAAAPLVVRAAPGARVVFVGSGAIPPAQPLQDAPGVSWFPYSSPISEPPAIWEPEARVRYTLGADLDSVARFEATYLVRDGRIYFHTSDSLLPRGRSVLMGVREYGIRIRRPRVTVRDIEFRDFVARGKYASGIRSTADDVTIERCTVGNAAFGFILSGSRNALVDCTARDVGGGVYIDGADARVESCRFFKTRDAFMIPSYAQDDCGIQYYQPARGGTIRGNLAVGFETGILVKTERAPYLIERNTLVGGGLTNGFIATEWHPETVFRQNVVADYVAPILTPTSIDRPGIGGNCYWPSRRPDGRPPGPSTEPGSIVGDPGFVNPAGEDYSLGPDSPCLGVKAAASGVGAPPRADSATSASRPPREWHVGLSGRMDGAATADDPLRTLQDAVDRAGPGDTIVVHPGIYPDAVRFTRAGSEGRPITLTARQKGTVILDGNRRVGSMIAIDEAPFVAIRDLEIRWYRDYGIEVENSPNVTVSGCRIWNGHWTGTWPNGTAVWVERSPRFTGDHNILFAQERGIWLHDSPRSTITHNTAVGNLYGGVLFGRSIEGSVCRNNSLTFQWNDAMAVVESAARPGLLATFDCDYNNYGMIVKGGPLVATRPIDQQLRQESKALIFYMEEPNPFRRFLSLQEWRDFSALDRHSIVADPLYVSTPQRDFRLEPSSPNIGAGAGGATIGAME